jgi:pantetheine-phosphate adenylyltransferase
MTHVLCPGSFDPPTLGHLDVIRRASRLFDRVTVAVLINPAKSGLFTVDERIALLRKATEAWPAVSVDSFGGLLVDYCERHGVDAILKGIRAAGDADYELPMAHMNAHLTGVQTLFLPTAPEYSYVSSSLVKEIAHHGGDIAGLVPESVARALAERERRPE